METSSNSSAPRSNGEANPTWLNQKFKVTYIKNVFATEVRTEETTLPDLMEKIKNTRADTKKGLPLLKLAEFGTTRTPTNSLRHNPNVLRVFGVEGDYDGGSLSLDGICRKLSESAVLSLVHTTPSHSATKTCCRIICPFSDALDPGHQQQMVSRLNGVVDATLAPESYTLSQSYFFGCVEGGTIETRLIDGTPIDLLTGLDNVARGKSAQNRKPSSAGVSSATPSPPLSGTKPKAFMGADFTDMNAAAQAGLDLSWFEKLASAEKNDLTTTCLDAIDNQTSDPRLRWLHYGFAIGHAWSMGADEAPDAYVAWSRRGANFQNDQECIDVVKAYKPGPNSITVGTLIRDAELAGADLSRFRNGGTGASSGTMNTSSGNMNMGTTTNASPAPTLICDAKGGALPILANVMTILRNDSAVKDCIVYDQMLLGIVLKSPFPGQGRDEIPRLIRDSDVSALQEWLQQNKLPRISKDVTAQAVEAYAAVNRYHPLKQYLRRITWDGILRLPYWLHDYLGAEFSPYSARIGTMFLVAMVARVLTPGCKVDYMLILEGDQGSGKSSICATLGGDYYSDNIPDIKNGKDVSQHLRGKWLVEAPELAAIYKSDQESLKSFASRTHERYRPPYGRYEVEEPRQCVIVGTTNQSNYLRDETGARRFWPVKVGFIDREKLEHDRDQIFAEAVVRFDGGSKWWPDQAFENLHIQPQQDDRYEADEWEQIIAAHLGGRINSGIRPIRVTVEEIARDALEIPRDRLDPRIQKRVGSSLRRLGLVAKRSSMSRWWEL